jgi:hypothetical protein
MTMAMDLLAPVPRDRTFVRETEDGWYTEVSIPTDEFAYGSQLYQEIRFICDDEHHRWIGSMRDEEGKEVTGIVTFGGRWTVIRFDTENGETFFRGHTKNLERAFELAAKQMLQAYGYTIKGGVLQTATETD